MAISDVLKNFRQGEYGHKEEEGKPEKGMSSRSFKLTDDEVKGVGEYQPGSEVQCLVTGRLGDNGMLTISKVEPASGGMEGEDEMAAKVAGVEPPMFQPRTVASPS